MTLLIIIIACLIYAKYQRVDLDETIEGDLILWYGRDAIRKNIRVWKNKR